MTYTTLACAAVLLAVLLDLLLLRTRVVLTRRFAVFAAVMLLFFLVVNGILTGLPVVMYSPHAITGLRVHSIPIEDFLYLFSLITPTVSVYEYLSARRERAGGQRKPPGQAS